VRINNLKARNRIAVPDVPVSSRSYTNDCSRATKAMNGQYRGILLVLLSYSLLAVESIIVHRLGPQTTVLQLTLLRSIGGATLVFALSGGQGWKMFHTKVLWLQGLRGVLTVTSMWALFYAFTVLPLTEATAITYTRGAFLAGLALLVLGERVGVARWIAILVGTAGVLITLRPDFAQWNIGYIVAIAAMLLNAGSIVATKVLERRDSALTVMAYINLITFLMSLPSLASPWTLSLWPWLVAATVVGPIALYCNLLAVRFADVSALAPYDYVRLIIGIAAGYLMFSELPNANAYYGAILILSGSILVALSARRRAKNHGQSPQSGAAVLFCRSRQQA
jgi:drug/metabolite transporter (DMT)-like permease